ncbi:tumor necrosis factor receptor superfamily member 14 isoform X3 [Acinonyx jubatus]|uniref:Tumor necrosis factor receptor superfamily member 14 isoform X3 n=1 Tax=Acinonyx jubatus TaxID=32536 RepID=A0ABM3NQK0_ACIJB|nr:tumor necrosis factor receptor superfamily member 14 isoform X3 [Acinonyx jubatus]
MSLTLYLLLLGPLRCSLAAAPCKEEEYPVGAECCPKCGPGYRVQEACGELTGTLCVPCDPGTYTAHLNGLSECLQCRVCDPAMGLVTRRQCSRTENTVCVCDQGHFCVSESGDDCAECRPHTACRPGQRVQQRGTEWQDRVCEDCPPETFSPSGTLEECQPWTSLRESPCLDSGAHTPHHISRELKVSRCELPGGQGRPFFPGAGLEGCCRQIPSPLWFWGVPRYRGHGGSQRIWSQGGSQSEGSILPATIPGAQS